MRRDTQFFDVDGATPSERYQILSVDGPDGEALAYVFPPSGMERRWRIDVESPVAATILIEGDVDGSLARTVAVAIVRAATCGYVRLRF